MVLDHVAHLTGLVKIAPAPFNAHFFRHGNFYVIDSAVIPVVHKQGVGKTQCQQVQYRFLCRDSGRCGKPGTFEILAYLIIDFARCCQ